MCQPDPAPETSRNTLRDGWVKHDMCGDTYVLTPSSFVALLFYSKRVAATGLFNHGQATSDLFSAARALQMSICMYMSPASRMLFGKNKCRAHGKKEGLVNTREATAVAMLLAQPNAGRQKGLFNHREAGHTAEAFAGEPGSAAPHPVPPAPGPDNRLPCGEQPVAAASGASRSETVHAVQHRGSRGLPFPTAALPAQPRPRQPPLQTAFLFDCGTPFRIILPAKSLHRGGPVSGVPDEQESLAAARGDPAGGLTGVRPRVNGEAGHRARVALERRERSSALR